MFKKYANLGAIDLFLITIFFTAIVLNSAINNEYPRDIASLLIIAGFLMLGAVILVPIYAVKVLSKKEGSNWIFVASIWYCSIGTGVIAGFIAKNIYDLVIINFNLSQVFYIVLAVIVLILLLHAIYKIKKIHKHFI